MARSRGWVFTVNNYTEDDRKRLWDADSRYIIIGSEMGSGTPHLQGYVEFACLKTLTGLRKISERAHWEARKGTPQQAADYCKKEGNFEERGEIPRQGERTDLAGVLRTLKESGMAKVLEDHPETFIRYNRGLYAANSLIQPDRSEPPTVIWLWGGTGCGKTREAVNCPDFYIKPNGKWWDGYNQQKRIVIDDFDEETWSYRDLLRFLDRYPYRGEIKGGFIKINSPEIYITCEWAPDRFWHGTALAQVLRRITEVRNMIISNMIRSVG